MGGMRAAILWTILAAAPVAAAAADEGEAKAPAPKKAEEKAPEKKAEKAPEKKPEKPLAVRAPRSKGEALAMLGRIELPSVTFEETPLPQVVSWLSAATGVNMVLGPALLKEGDPDAIRVTLALRKVTALQVLELVSEGHGLGIGFRSGVLLVTTPKEARGKPFLRLYVVSDITAPLRDFPAPDLMLRPAGAEYEPEQESETKSAFSSAEDVLTLVKDHCGTGTWEDGDTSASTMGETLVVRQYAEVHAEIARLLAALRAAR